MQLDEENCKPSTLVIAIDQAEELFLSEGKSEAEVFLKLISELSRNKDINLIILSTIRSDDYKNLQTVKELEGVSQQTFSLLPIVKGAYQQIIEGPVKLLEKTNRPLVIEPQLTERLLKDLEEDDSKDALPLLAFTLERLYIDYGDDGDLRLEEYLTFEKNIGGTKQTLGLGGLSGVVEMAVEHALNEAQKDPKIPTDKTECLRLLRRGLIPWLAGIDPQTKSPRRRVARYGEIPKESRALVDYLVEYRLLSKDVNKNNIVTIEPAHESILRQWQQLNGWLKEDMAELSALETLKSATRDWESNNRSNGWLSHRSGRLQDAENLLKREDFSKIINDSQRAYLAACRTVEDKQKDAELKKAQELAKAQQEALKKQKQVTRRTLVGLVVSSVLLLFAVGAMFWALENQKWAIEKKEEAEKLTKEFQLKNREYIKLTMSTMKKNMKYLATKRKLINVAKLDLIKKEKLELIITQMDSNESDWDGVELYHGLENSTKFNYKTQKNKIYYYSKIFNLPISLRKKIEYEYPGLINAILSTESMGDNERKYWFKTIPSMKEEQIIRLYAILANELDMLIKLEGKYQDAITTLDDQPLIEFAKMHKKKMQTKRIVPTDDIDYWENYKFLFGNKKPMEKSEILEMLTYVRQFNYNGVADFQGTSLYINLLEKIISLSPNEKKSIYQQKLWKFFRTIYDKGYVSRRDVAEKALELSWTLLNNHNPSDAIIVLKKVIQFTPNNLLLEKNLAIAYLIQGNKSKAMSIFQKYRDIPILYNKKTILWQQLFLNDMEKFKITNLLDPDILSKIRLKISKFSLNNVDYEILSNNIKSLTEKEKKNTISSADILKALQIESEKIQHSKNFYTKDMFELYEKVYWKIYKLINANKKLELAKYFMSISKDMRINGVISQREFASHMLDVTWNSLFTKDQKELENAIALSKKAKQIAPDFLAINTNYAHALALLGKENEALKIYKDNLGKTIYWLNGKEVGSWENVILKDFEALEKKGIHSSTFDKVKKLIEKYKSKQPKITDKK